jgi:Tfp pilus assembly protein FimV
MSTITLQPAQALSVARPSVRLTRRGRLVVFGLALLAVLALGLLLTPGSSATKSAEPTETVMVGSGETLWQIADEVAAPGETSAMVQHLIELNDLDSAMLIAGQELRVPAS